MLSVALGALTDCQWQKEQAVELWQPPRAIGARPASNGSLVLAYGEDEAHYRLNDWSFSQLCRLAGVAKETVNRLSPDTAARVFGATLPQGNKPLQLFGPSRLSSGRWSLWTSPSAGSSTGIRQRSRPKPVQGSCCGAVCETLAV